jgi:DNA polymerase-3 subunit alpha
MDMKPRELANVVAMVALYRPGPLEFIPTYINRMHEREQVEYRHPALEPIFKETFGIPVYQEQIMSAAMDLAGYSASEADDLRKAIAKKKAKALKKHRANFIQGATNRGIGQQTASSIFDDWENFARYGFNKAHAADYGVIAVQTAYLKAHYPIEFMTATLSVFKHDTDKVALYIADCRRMGIDVLPPEINASGLDFMIEDREGHPAAIRFGLSAVKNVGDSAVEVILAARRKAGPFESLDEFARRVDLRHVGKRALESLVRVGALDYFGPRIAVLDSIERILSLSSAHFRAIEVGQMSFFGSENGLTDSLELSRGPSDVPQRRQLSWEKELLGVYVSDHPLTPHIENLARVITHFSAELGDAEHGQQVCVAGEVSNIRPYQTRAGKPMGFVSIEDLQGLVDLVVFNRVWRDVTKWLQSGMIVVVKGKVDTERGDPKILVDMISVDLENIKPLVEPKQIGPPPPEDVPVDLVDEPELISSDLDPYDPPPVPEMDVWEDIPVEATMAETVDDSPSLEKVHPESVVGESPSIPESQTGVGGHVPHSEASSTVSEPDSVLHTTSPSDSLSYASLMSVGTGRAEPTDPQMVTIVLRSTGDRRRDALRMRRVHGLLTSYPGNDRFVFNVYETSRRYHLEFPSSTTGYCPELHAQLHALLGEGSVRVEPLRLQ